MLNLASIYILSQILLPDDFGYQTTVSVALGLVAIFQDFGFRSAIIRVEEVSQSSLSAYFWFILGFAVFLYLVILIGAPFISELLLKESDKIALVTDLLRLQGFTIILGGLSVVSESLLLRNLKFKPIFFINVVAFFLASVVSIVLALKGYGVLALVYKQLLMVLILGGGFMVMAKWIPTFRFNRQHIKEQFRFTGFLTLGNIANYFVRNIDYIIISKLLGANVLGQYALAYKIMLTPMKNISAVILKVMYPVLSKLHRNGENIGSAYFKIVEIIAILVFPIMAVLSGLSEPICAVFFDEKWTYLAPLLLIFAWLGALQATTTPVGVLFQLSGRTDHMLYYNIFSSVATVCALVFGSRWGIMGIAYANFLVWVILIFPTVSVLSFSYFKLRLLQFLSSIIKPLLTGLAVFVLLLGMVWITDGLLFKPVYIGILAISAFILYHIIMLKVFKLNILNTFRLVLKR